jgi:hypothetical protein
MTFTIDTVLILLAVICFGAKFAGVQTKLDLIAGGFMFLALTLLV